MVMSIHSHSNKALRVTQEWVSISNFIFTERKQQVEITSSIDNHINPINKYSHTMHYGSHNNGSGTTISFSAIPKKHGKDNMQI